MKQELNNNIEINKKNKDYVGADDPVRPIPKRNTPINKRRKQKMNKNLESIDTVHTHTHNTILEK